MTCIVALETKDTFIFASDTCSYSGDIILYNNKPKFIEKYNNLIIATSGLCLVSDVIEYFIPNDPDRDSPKKYIITHLIPLLRKKLSEYDDSLSKNMESCLLILCNYKLFIVFADYSVHEVIIDYAAIGSGCDVALGALYGSSLPPIDKAKQAVEAARFHKNNVGGEVNIKVVFKPQTK